MKLPYYDYIKDFPRGNGWRTSQDTFEGEIIDTPLYIFKNGKYKGMPLQLIADPCWRGLIKYIDYGLIFITRECIGKLDCEKNKMISIKAANDSKLSFCRVFSLNDEIYTNPLSCFYQGMSFLEVAELDPHYLIKVIERGFFPTYGKNQIYYAEDHSYTLYGDVDGLKRILRQLEWKRQAKEFALLLNKTINRINNYIEEEYNRRMAYQEEEERRYYENEGYRDAYDGNPDAEWNTD